MKKALAVLLSLALLVSLAVPAYAAEPYDADWIPPVPDFIIPAGNGFRFSYDVPGVPASKEYQDVSDWIAALAEDNALFLILLDQGVYNRYKEENGVDYDRQFSLYIVSPDKKSDGSYYDLGGFEHMGGPQHQQQMNVPGPMSYLCLNSPHSFAKVIYDVKANELVLSPSLSHLPGGSGSKIRFTYVLAAGNYQSLVSNFPAIQNGSFAETSEVYPGFTQVSGKDFGVGTIYQQFTAEGKAVEHWRDYDWWLGIEGEPIPPYNPNLDKDQDTDGDGKPDINVDTNGDGKPDLNIDTDGDGKPDINIDTNGDGKPDLNIDTDGDGKPDINIDTNGDRKPDLNIDTDGDRKPDVNVDIDGDGRPDVNVKPGEGSGGGSSGSGSSGSGSGSEGGSTSGGSSGGGSEGGSSGGGSEGGSSSGGSSGSEGGSSSDKGSGSPDTWFDPSDGGVSYDPWEFFDPFKSEYDPVPWDKDYNPTKPGDSIYSGYDPFAVFNNMLKEMFGG
jgi:hypothetical protein